MRPFKPLLCLLAFATATALPAQSVSTTPEIIPIKSFEANEGFEYTYGSWRGHTQTSLEGLAIVGESTAKGGGGGPVSVDISRAQNLFVTLRKLPQHRANVLNVILMDGSGRGAGFILNLSKVGADWTVLQLNIARQSFQPPNMQPGPDWSAITGYQVQGNYGGDTPVAVQIREICAAPPPAALVP